MKTLDSDLHNDLRGGLGDVHLPHRLQGLLGDALDDDETLVWCGQPKPVFWSKGSVWAFWCAILWTAFVVFWTASASGFQWPNFSKPVVVFPLVGMFFVLIGVIRLCSPLFNRRNLKQTVYAITDQRVVSIRGAWKTVVVTFLVDELEVIERTENRDGTGDLMFFRSVAWDSKGEKTINLVGFERIQDAKHVERLIRDLVVSHGSQSGALG